MHPHDSIPMPPVEQLPRLEMRPRLLAVYIGIGLIILTASIFAAMLLRRADADAERIVENLSRHASVVARLRQEFLLVRVAEKNLIIEDSQEGMDVFEKRISDSEAQITNLLAEFGAAPMDDEIAARLREFSKGFDDFRVSLREMIRLSREHTLARAAELSRSRGRELFQQARESLVSLIERNREQIVTESGDPGNTSDIEMKTDLVAAARESLEEMHDLLYNEQAILTVFSKEERAGIVARLQTREATVTALASKLAASAAAEDRTDAASFRRAFDAWTANSAEVRRLAQEDSKARAMALSTSAVRDAYLRASQALDGIMQRSEESILGLKAAQERAIAAGRTALVATAIAGLLVIALTAWVIVNVVLREYRAAADMLVRGG